MAIILQHNQIEWWTDAAKSKVHIPFFYANFVAVLSEDKQSFDVLKDRQGVFAKDVPIAELSYYVERAG